MPTGSFAFNCRCDCFCKPSEKLVHCPDIEQQPPLRESAVDYSRRPRRRLLFSEYIAVVPTSICVFLGDAIQRHVTIGGESTRAAGGSGRAREATPSIEVPIGGE